MVIDCILDRQYDDEHGFPYNAHDFYFSVARYKGIAFPITRAMDYGEEKDVKSALCAYIDEQGYNPEIKDYINSVNWL